MIVLAIHQYKIEDTGKTRTSCKFVWNQDVHQVRANNNLSGVFLSWLHVLLTAFQRLSEIGSADCGSTPGCNSSGTWYSLLTISGNDPELSRESVYLTGNHRVIQHGNLTGMVHFQTTASWTTI
jgi:hypothetical protein